jgi:hypothetical protein
MTTKEQQADIQRRREQTERELNKHEESKNFDDLELNEQGLWVNKKTGKVSLPKRRSFDWDAMLG